MSRSGYIDDYDYEYAGLYRGTVARATKGKRGQAFFRELAEAMDAMPERVLIAGELVNEYGDCCPIGAVCLKRGVDTSGIDYEAPEQVAAAVGIAQCLAAEIEYMNDEWLPRESPEQRWKRMREWVGKQIVDDDHKN